MKCSKCKEECNIFYFRYDEPFCAECGLNLLIKTDKQIETLKAKLEIAVKALEWMNNKMDKKTSLNYWLSLDKDVIAATMVGVEVKAKQALAEIGEVK
jgi:hypothetical protein